MERGGLRKKGDVDFDALWGPRKSSAASSSGLEIKICGGRGQCSFGNDSCKLQTGNERRKVQKNPHPPIT